MFTIPTAVWPKRLYLALLISAIRPQCFLFAALRANEINQGQNSTGGVAREQGQQLNVSEETKYMPSVLGRRSGRRPLSLLTPAPAPVVVGARGEGEAGRGGVRIIKFVQGMNGKFKRKG